MVGYLLDWLSESNQKNHLHVQALAFTLTPKTAKKIMLNKCNFFDKYNLSFMSHTAITPKFEMRWVNFVNALPLCKVGERSY